MNTDLLRVEREVLLQYIGKYPTDPNLYVHPAKPHHTSLKEEWEKVERNVRATAAVYGIDIKFQGANGHRIINIILDP